MESNIIGNVETYDRIANQRGSSLIFVKSKTPFSACSDTIWFNCKSKKRYFFGWTADQFDDVVYTGECKRYNSSSH